MGAGVTGRPSMNRRGLSLIEMLIALAVVAVALFAIAATQVSAFTANIQAREIAMVRDIASQAVAEVRSVVVGFAYANAANWDELLDPSSGMVQCDVPDPNTLQAVGSGSRPTTTDLGTGSCEGSYTVLASDGVTYTLRWRLGVAGQAVDVLPGVDSPQLALIHVLVRVDWQRRGDPRSMSFDDYIGCVDIDPTTCPVPDVPL